MTQDISPMVKSEIKKLDSIMNSLRKKYKNQIDIPGGFVTVSVLNFDNDLINVEVKYGVSTSSYADKISIDRKNMSAETILKP